MTIRLLLPCALLLGHVLPAQHPPGYQTPPPALAALVDAPATPTLTLSPDQTRALQLTLAPRPTVADLAAPELRLAGIRFNPSTYGPTLSGSITHLALKSLTDSNEISVTGFPSDARLASPAWSPDGKFIAVVVYATPSTPGALWLIDTATAQARALTGPQLNSILGTPYDWLNARTLVVKFIPTNRGPVPSRNTTAAAPVIQQTSGEKAANRTYQDLLKDPTDEALLDYYATAELHRLDLDGTDQPLNINGLFTCEPSPDGNFLLINSIRRPYSYSVPLNLFSTRHDIHHADGRHLRTIATLPLAEKIPLAHNSTREGPRNLNWRADTPATLTWVEARDGGDAARPAEIRDELLQLPAPFDAAPTSLLTFKTRFASVVWGDANRALAYESWYKTRRVLLREFNPSAPASPPRVVQDYSSEDRYKNPGAPLQRRGPYGRSVLRLSPDRRSLFLLGAGASPTGSRPFIDRLDLATRETTRLWQSTPPLHEQPLALLGANSDRLLLTREAPDQFPNYHVLDLSSRASTALTAFPDPHPQFSNLRKEIISYTRPDGVKLTGTLYLPPAWQPADGPLPTLLWAYPVEVNDAATSGQITDSPHRFVRISPSGPLPYLALGYAVLDNPTMPIVGADGKEPNDTYLPQLIASAQAAIDELARRGVTDPKRVAIGGHSYGAFMTANLLAHTRLFRAGIARSGAYNRTLTPFGFHAEARSY